MNTNTYLHKKKKAVRKKHSVNTNSWHTHQITNTTRSNVQKLEICGCTRQKYSSTAVSPDNPLELLTADSFNIIINNIKNELTDEYMAKFWDKTLWVDGNWSRTNYKRSEILHLKPNTTYTFYRTLRDDPKNYELNYPRLSGANYYFGIRFKDNSSSSFYQQYGCNSWINCPGQGVANNSKYKVFTTDDSGEVWFILMSASSYLGGFKNSYCTNGMMIVEGEYTLEEMESNVIHIPSSITLDDGTEVELNLGHVSNDNGKPIYWDSIEVENDKVVYVKRTHEYTLDGSNARSTYGYGHTEILSAGKVHIRVHPGWMMNKNINNYGAKTNNVNGYWYRPTCNKFMGYQKMQYNANRVFCGEGGNYAGWITFIVNESELNTYDGNYIGVIYGNVVIPSDSICYFKINQVLYKFISPYELNECTSLSFNVTDNLLYLDGAMIDYEIANENDEIVNYIRFHIITNNNYYHYPSTNTLNGGELRSEVKTGAICRFNIYAGYASNATYYYKFTAPYDFNKYTNIYFDYDNTVLYIDGIEVAVEKVSSIDNKWVDLGFLWQSIRLKAQQYFKDQRLTGTPVVVRYPVAKTTTTDITNSDLGRQLLALKLRRNNVISTDNPYAYDNIKITYKKYGG